MDGPLIDSSNRKPSVFDFPVNKNRNTISNCNNKHTQVQIATEQLKRSMTLLNYQGRGLSPLNGQELLCACQSEGMERLT